jgi:hypothetical protein
MNGRELFQLISKNPNANEAELATKVKVHTTRSPLEYKALEPALDELKAIRISPFLATRVGVDEVTWYDFWFDSGQESVHYRILDDSGSGDPQDKLAQWMTRFRTRCQSMVQRKSFHEKAGPGQG